MNEYSLNQRSSGVLLVSLVIMSVLVVPSIALPMTTATIFQGTLTPTAFVYLPHVARQYRLLTVTPSATPSPTPTATPWGDRPGDYTNYRFNNDAGPFFNLDIYSTWESAPSTGYIYPAFQFFFQANQGGYMGMQLVGTQKKALFSIWDMTEGSGTAQPISSWCDRFGGEGTGARCLIDYDWVPGREYRLRVWAVDSDQNGESWVGAIQDTVTDIETQIGVIYLYNSGGYTGYGWLRTDTYTFLEYFGGPPGCDNQPYSRVLWRGPFANANDYIADQAVVPAYPNCTHNNVTTSGWPYVTHEAGGTTMLTTPAGTVLWDVP
jgi:hypothetical protein